MFESFFRGLFKLFFLGFVLLMAVLVIAAVVAAIVKNGWFFFGLILAAPFSHIFLRKISKKLDIELPEILLCSVADVYSALFEGKREIEEFENLAKKNKREIEQKIKTLQEKVEAIKKEYQNLKNKRVRKTLLSKPKISVRMKKAMESILANPKWTDLLENDEEKWGEYLL